jgi:hypothetical protein
MSLFGFSLGRDDRPGAGIAAAPSAPHSRPNAAQRVPRAAVRVVDRAGIVRPQTESAAVGQFLLWLNREGISGEHEWRNLWALYQNHYCIECEVKPVPESKKAYFAQALAQRARRGQVRIIENGRMRRITTYTIVDQTTEWA